MKSLFTFGNFKLPKTTAIFNVCPASMCPGATGSCQLMCNFKDGLQYCYARSAEARYREVRAHRDRQHQFWTGLWKPPLPEAAMIFIAHLLRDKGRRTITALRFNEAGDLTHGRELDLVCEIAKRLEALNINVYMYTSRWDLLAAEAARRLQRKRRPQFQGNLFVGCSGAFPARFFPHRRMLDTLNEQLNFRVFGFGVLPKDETKTDGERVCPGKCESCRMCYRADWRPGTIGIVERLRWGGKAINGKPFEGAF